MLTKEDLQRIEQYENDCTKLKTDMLKISKRYGVIELLRVISEVFAEVY